MNATFEIRALRILGCGEATLQSRTGLTIHGNEVLGALFMPYVPEDRSGESEKQWKDRFETFA